MPGTSAYNALEVPFAYPPLAFYLGAGLHGWLGIDVMRLVPLLASVLTIPAFYLLARSLAGPSMVTIAATGAFAIMPRTFEWMTMGGGLTRAPGLLLALVTLWLTHRMLRNPSVLTAAAAGLGGGLVAVTHPQAALFTLISGLLLIGALARDRRAARRVAIALGVAAIVSAPWLVAVISQHGLDPLLSASGTQPGPFIGLLSVLSFDVTGSRLFNVLGLLAGIGLLISVLRGLWLLPLWLVAAMVFDARGGGTYAAVPASLLAGRALVDFVLMPFWNAGAEIGPRRPLAHMRRYPARMALALVLVTAALVDSLGSQAAPTWRGVALTPAQRAGIAAAAEAAPAADYLVVSGQYWAVDATAEWFPVLSGARSAGTVQGHEWLGREEFGRWLEASEALRGCANAGAACLSDWSEEWGIDFSHVFIPKGSLSGGFGDADCCTGLRELLSIDGGYGVIYDGDGATIFEKLDG